MNTPITAVILAKNEEVNLPTCLAHLKGWAGEIFVVVDPSSTDRTMAIAEEAHATVVSHAFENYVAQRNWALKNLPFKNEWVLFVDADEYPTEELKRAMVAEISRNPAENGFYIPRRFIFWGKWLKHGGYYPVWILRLMRHQKARCEGALMDEHFAVEGITGRIDQDLVHDDKRGLEDWFGKHRRYAKLKAQEHLMGKSVEGPTGSDEASKRRAEKRRAWDTLPLFLRPFLYFGYRMFVQGGILDGIPGIVYHTLHGFWYPLLIDMEICRVRRTKYS